MELNLTDEEHTALFQKLNEFGSIKCFACAADPSFWGIVAALKEAKKRGLLKDKPDLESIFSDSQKLVALLTMVLPAPADGIAALVAFGIGICGPCVVDKVF